MLVLAGCHDGPTPPLAEAESASRALALGTPEVRPEEAEMHRLAARVPGFGGFYHDEGGDLVAFLADPAREADARAALEPLAAAARRERRGSGRVALRRGQFDFPTLAALRDQVSAALLETDGVAWVDLDERRNRVVVGVSSADARARVRRTAASFQATADAVEVVDDSVDYSVSPEPAPPLLPPAKTRLDARFDTLVGGISIGRVYDTSGGSSITRCTLGFVALRNATRVFVTASRCTERFWHGDTTAFFQPWPLASVFGAWRVGREDSDPRGHTCGFLSSNDCRYSDAAAVRVEDAVPISNARIARTRFFSDVAGQAGSVEIDPVNPYFRIVAKANPVQGQKVDKMGVQTGWTRGRVTSTCVDVNAQRIRKRLRCQTFVQLVVDARDVGAPVFLNHDDGTVTLVGLLWGYNSDRSYAIVSPMSGIERELGILAVANGLSTGGPDEPTIPPGGCSPSDPTQLC